MRAKPAFLALVLLLAASPAFAASFDCNKASAMDELAVCNDRELSELDIRMATMFDLITGLVPMGTRGAIQDEQLAWLKERTACASDRSCLRRSYRTRIDALQKHYDDIRSRGPF